MRPIFDSWLEPLKSVGARRNVGEPVGSTDHLSFIDAGVPGFNPIQDYGNYDIRTHHTNMDTVDRLDVNDIRQAAIVMALIILLIPIGVGLAFLALAQDLQVPSAAPSSTR